MSKTQDSVIDDFHKIYYGDSSPHRWEKTSWLGIQTLKCPLDLWIYQEIIYDVKPDIIIETGTWSGGSALFLATICDSINNGMIFSIDTSKKEFPFHNRITYFTGSSTNDEIFKKVTKQVKKTDKVLVILDSDHSKEHVLKEMELYGNLITKDSYLIVEDTNINGHPVLPDWGLGPMEAVEEFLLRHSEFSIDKSKENLLMTFNPNGYLKKNS